MKTPFVESEGEFFVTIKASGINSLIPYIDGMRVVTFPKCRKVYLYLDDAIAWHEKELGIYPLCASESKKALELLKQARERLIAERAIALQEMGR